MVTVQRGVQAARATTAVAGLLVVAAGIAEILAQLSRWAPCVGDYEAPACGALQDHRYDYFLPTAPWVPVDNPEFIPEAAWVPIPGAATLTGVAFVLLAATLLLRTGAVAERSRSGAVAGAAWLLLAGLVLAVGVVNIASDTVAGPLAGTPQLAVAWMTLGPLLGIGLAIRLATRPHAGPAAWILAAVVVVVAFRGSLLEYFVVIPPYSSYDTPPFQGAPGAVALVLLGGALMAVAARPRHTR